ncbi:hypothetical protein BL166_00002045 [Klebsiella pneumoniae]|nr:hypothetical protein BL166_00002045 [Klebsiella pneumoniae]
MYRSTWKVRCTAFTAGTLGRVVGRVVGVVVGRVVGAGTVVAGDVGHGVIAGTEVVGAGLVGRGAVVGYTQHRSGDAVSPCDVPCRLSDRPRPHLP